MRRIVFEAECFITEKDFNKFNKKRMLIWDINSPLGTVFNKPIKIKIAYIDKDYNDKA